MAETVFLTGGSGFIGNRCLIKALRDGYHVKASVRSQTKAEAVRNSAGSFARNLSFVVIPEFSAPGVFDDCVKDVDYIVHLASPRGVPPGGPEMYKIVTEPAITGTLHILEAAMKSSSVKKVVITSSVGAAVLRSKNFGPDVDGVSYTAASRVSETYYESIKADEYYSAGKTLALNATDKFVKERDPHFDVINVLPSFALGPFELASTTDQLLAPTNYRGLAIAIGRKLNPAPTSCVHVDDLAKIHIDILHMKTQRYQSFGAGCQMSFAEQVDIIRKHFPSAVQKGIFPMDGEAPDRPFLFDTAATESFFGWKFKPFEEQVVDLARNYLELVDESEP